MADLAPIILFVYNRLNHTIKTITELKQTCMIVNYLFSRCKNNDAYSEVERVLNYIKLLMVLKKLQ